MAKFYLKDFVADNIVTSIDSVTWEVALDKNFKHIIDSTIRNRDCIFVWETPLKRVDKKGYYDEFDEIYARVKIHSRNGNNINDSDWYYAKARKKKKIKLTYRGKVIKETYIEQ